MVPKWLVVLLLVGAAGFGVAVYLGIVDWQDAKTRARVELSNAVGQAQNAVEGVVSGVGSGGTTPRRSDAEEARLAAQCRQNLRRIADAKRSVERDRGTVSRELPRGAVLEKLGGSLPRCPLGGSYRIGPTESLPQCSHAARGTVDQADDHILRNY